MAESKPRSAFLPILLLLVVLVVIFVGVVMFVPLVECEGCTGIGALSIHELALVAGSKFNSYNESAPLACSWCSGSGKWTLFSREFEEVRPGLCLRHFFPKYVFKFLHERRSCTP